MQELNKNQSHMVTHVHINVKKSPNTFLVKFPTIMLIFEMAKPLSQVDFIQSVVA